MMFKDKVKEAVITIRPKLEEYAEGYVEFVGMDEAQGTVKVKLIGGRVC